MIGKSIFNGVKNVGKAAFGSAKAVGETAIGGSKLVGSAIIKNSMNRPLTSLAAIGTGVVVGKLLADEDGNVDPGYAEKKGALAATVGVAAGVGSSIATVGAGIAGAGIMGLGALGTVGKSMVKTPKSNVKVNLSNIGENFKLNKPIAVPLLLGSMAVKSVASGIHSFEKSRAGVNDGRIRTATPDYQRLLTNSSQTSYADNAGATGDLVFDLYNNRR